MSEISNDDEEQQVCCQPTAGSIQTWDGPVLAPYEECKPGYERGILSALPSMTDYFPSPTEDRYELCLWNIWHKGDDPAIKDAYKQKINELQSRVGPLSCDDRYIRIQLRQP